MATVNIANISQLAPSRSDNAQVGMLSSPPSAPVFNEAFSRAHQQLRHTAAKSGNSMPSHASVGKHSEPSTNASNVSPKARQTHRMGSDAHLKEAPQAEQQPSKNVGSKQNSQKQKSVATDDPRQVASEQDPQDSAKVLKKEKDLHSTRDGQTKSGQQPVREQNAHVKGAEKKLATEDTPVATKDDSLVVVSEDESKAMQLLSRLEKSQNADMQLEQVVSVSDKLKLAMQVLEQAKKLNASQQVSAEDGKPPSALELALMMLQKVQSSDAQTHLDMSKSSDVTSLQLHQTLKMLNRAIVQSESGKSHDTEHLNQIDPKLREVLQQLSEKLIQLSSTDTSPHAEQSNGHLKGVKSAKTEQQHSDDDASLLSQIQIQLASLLNLPAPEKNQSSDSGSSLQNEQSSLAKSSPAAKMVKNVALLALAELKLQHMQGAKQQSPNPSDNQSSQKLADKIAVLTEQLSHLVTGNKVVKETQSEAIKVNMNHSPSQATAAHVQHRATASSSIQNLVHSSHAEQSESMLSSDDVAKKTVNAPAENHSAAVKVSPSQAQTPAAQSIQQALAQNSAPGTDTKTNVTNIANHGQAIKGDEQAVMTAAAQSSDLHAQKKDGHQPAHSTQFGNSDLAVKSEISLSAGHQQSGLGAQGQHQGGAQLGTNANSPLTTAAKSDGSFASQMAMNQPGKLPSELNERINYMVSNRLHSADIRLDPAHLGAMQIRLHLNHDQAQVQIHVHNPQAREMLEQSMPKLRDMLAQQGIQLGQSQINQGNSGNSQQGFAQTGGQSQGSFAGQQPLAHLGHEVAAEESLPHLLHSQLSTDDGIDYYA
ncbi:flagellar hook-length control protein FliK [Celerinatantimonas diazotrophica]|uniref:Flagellar hook-length control protein FliK n=1 Tax=Celerinatantimonas diazotrophica TaxID=412034 RepID=A0A4R1JME1_9GAMM|nr:flagellar hook-length control protein FliK [Celerinatantimonas diazotrophica]TCK52130.1 flagellar hook-length control protein FliK [Celerinatantimonas diazotrophica]CAG9296165.1 hypothetical protein CEDIAZO_01308 [Celerinatantimonas diazotrophica]